MNTVSRRKAAETYAASRKAKGWAKVTVWLSPEALTALEALKAVHGSRDAALSAAVLKLTASGPVGEVGAEGDTRPNPKPLRTPKPLPSPDMKGKVGKAVQPQEKGLGLGVQIGPSPVVPGSRLKPDKPKGPKR